jgi:ATP-dependent DNA helicase RecQ
VNLIIDIGNTIAKMAVFDGGRDGGEGMCITFYSNKDLQKLEKFMQGKPISEQEIGKQLLLETAAYAESSLCRRKILLHYFGEEYTEDNCGNCDNCLNPKKQVEAQDSLCAVIETIIAVKENFKQDYIVDILLGKETSEVLAHKHEDLEVFGYSYEMTIRVLRSQLKARLKADNVIDKDHL